jgi:tetratricopeptide (TPR) repeat protein
MTNDREHVAEEVLAAYVDDPESVEDRAAVEEHLATCTACRRIADDLRAVMAAIGDEETWWIAGEMINGDGQRAIREFVERLEAEDAEAERMLEPILESQYLFTKANITRRRRFHTGGVVRRLCEHAWEECQREPRFASVLAETAAAIADALPDDYYPAGAVNELRGRAWKEYSTTCRYRGAFPAGFDALVRAERAYRRLIDPDVHLATVDMGRAAMLFEQQRYQEALPCARKAADVFAERRDTKRYFDAKEWEAVILHRLGDVAGARATYQAAYDMADGADDVEMKARAANNLGIAYHDEGDLGSASKYLRVALQIYEALEQTTMIVHVRWWIANVSLAGGNAIDAAQRLPAIINELEATGRASGAARARLDLAEALVQLGRFDEVHAIASALVTYFRNAKMITGALTAAAYLKEAAMNRSLTVDGVRHVKKYLADVERAPDLLFLPPPQ